MRRILLMVPLAVCLACAGCQEAASGKAKVTGKVTFSDGKPLPGGRIDFRSPDGSLVSGQIKSDGTYEADDVPPGDQQVAIENKHLKAFGPPPPGLAPLPGSDQTYVPIDPKYSSPATSGLTTNIQAGDDTYDVQIN
jgi:hypothetical protein